MSPWAGPSWMLPELGVTVFVRRVALQELAADPRRAKLLKLAMSCLPADARREAREQCVAIRPGCPVRRYCIMPIITDRLSYQIVPLGSMASGFALKVDGTIRRTGPRALPLAAYADALIAGASELDADCIARAIGNRPWPPSLQERTAVQDAEERQSPSREPLKHPIGVLEQILGEAHELIRRRLQETGLEAPLLILGATPDNQVILRGNVDMEGVRTFGESLQAVADEISASPSPGDTTH